MLEDAGSGWQGSKQCRAEQECQINRHGGAVPKDEAKSVWQQWKSLPMKGDGLRVPAVVVRCHQDLV